MRIIKKDRIEMNTNMSRNCLKSIAQFCFIASIIGCASFANAEADVFAKIKEAMVVLKAETSKLGEPKVDGAKLIFGTTTLNDNFQIVDDVKSKFDCTATLFVKSGEEYVRVSTNVMKDGKRAVGTPLDPKGPAIAAIKKDESYYGMADILGTQYSTGYEPIKNSSGETVGIYYIGFMVEAGTIEF